jgi:hypothetical protein
MGKDKRITVNQHIQQVHEAYDNLEQIALAAARRTLNEEFGFGAKRQALFQKAYLMNFGEAAATYAEKVRSELRRQTR